MIIENRCEFFRREGLLRSLWTTNARGKAPSKPHGNLNVREGTKILVGVQEVLQFPRFPMSVHRKKKKMVKQAVSHFQSRGAASFRTWHDWAIYGCTVLDHLKIPVELIGIEPTTYSLRTNRSPKLSYSPMWIHCKLSVFPSNLPKDMPQNVNCSLQFAYSW